MKNLITALIFFCAFKSFGQLSGNYCYEDFYSTQFCIDFLSTDSFSYYTSGCGLPKEGIGTYSVVKDTLTLLFATDYKKIGIQSASTKLASNFSDTIILSIQVLDALDDVPLPFVNILAEDSESRLKGGDLTNQNGEAILKFSINDSISHLNFSYLGYTPVSLDIPVNMNQNIQIKIARSLLTIESGSMWKYEIKTLSRKKIRMRRLPIEFQAGFDIYKRTETSTH